MFDYIFEEPTNIDDVLEFIRTKVAFVNDRRVRERRIGFDRRKSFGKQKENNDYAQSEYPIKRSLLNVGAFKIDYDFMTATVYGKTVRFSPKEFRLVDLFIKNLDSVVKAEDILKVIWSENSRATKADMYQYIYMLRHKLEKNPHEPEMLLTVKGSGYKLMLLRKV